MVNTDWPVWIEIGYLHEDDYRKVHTMTTYDKIAMYKWLLHHNKYRYCIHQLSWIHHHGFEQLRYTHMLWYENSQNTCTYMMKTTWTDKSNRGWLCCDKRKREKNPEVWSMIHVWSMILILLIICLFGQWLWTRPILTLLSTGWSQEKDSMANKWKY